MAGRREVEVEIEGRRLKLSNLDKIFYPATGFTKGEVIDYYTRIAPALLPHLADRPLTLKRYPDGVTGSFFYEKRCPAHRPQWVRTEPVWSEGNQDVIRFCVVDDLPTLVWAANLADLEMHTYLHRFPRVEEPTLLVFDLDPGPPADALQCCEVALLLRALLERLDLASYAKTSGSKGVQVYVPLNVATTYDVTKSFARAVAERLAAERPDLVVSSMKKSLRVGKVLVDWSQNDEHKTTVCVWSLRARERPTVSTPLRWSEVEAALRGRDATRLAIDAAAAVSRFERDGDLFARVLTDEQRLPAIEEVTRGQQRRGATRVHPGGAAPPPRPRAQGRKPKSNAERGSAHAERQRGARRTKREESQGAGRTGSGRTGRRGASTPRLGDAPGAAADGYFSSE